MDTATQVMTALKMVFQTVSRVSVSTAAGAVVLSMLLSSCGSGGGGSAGSLTSDIKATLQSVHQGRLVDVYGFRIVSGTKRVELYDKDPWSLDRRWTAAWTRS